MKKTMSLAAASLFAASAAYADFAEGPVVPEVVVLTGCAFCGVRTDGGITFDNMATAATIARLCPEGSPAWNEVNGLGPENDLPFQAQ